MLSAAIAFQDLQKENSQTIDQVKVALASHPWRCSRWENSLAPFSGNDRDLMLFMLAARWADDVRTKDRAQHRGTWHYINMPFKPAGAPPHIAPKPAGMPNVLTGLVANESSPKPMQTQNRKP